MRAGLPELIPGASSTVVSVKVDHPAMDTQSHPVSKADRSMIASRVDMTIAGSTLEGYKPSWGTWLRFLGEAKPDLVKDPTLVEHTHTVVEDLLIVFMCWLNGEDGQGEQGPLGSQEGSVANTGRIMQGLAHHFKRNSISTAPFESERVLRVRGTFRPSAREQSLIHDDNETLAASFEMIEYVMQTFFEDLRSKPLGERSAGDFKVGKNVNAEINIDAMGTALALSYSVVCTSRVGEVAHTGPAKGTDLVDKHAVQTRDVHFTVADIDNKDWLLFSNDLPERLEEKDIRQLTMYLISNKADQKGMKTRIVNVLPTSNRSRAFMSQMFHYCKIRGRREDDDMFFSRVYNKLSKKVNSTMVNAMWGLVSTHFSLEKGSLTSKSGKKLAVDMIANTDGGSSSSSSCDKGPAASFHASQNSQDHYRSRIMGGAGNSRAMDDSSQGLSTEQIRQAGALLQKPIPGGGKSVVLSERA